MDVRKNAPTRESNIELMRILAMVGVVMLHYNNADIGGALEWTAPGSVNFWIANALEALAIGAVNLFVLINGYFLCTSRRRSLLKPLRLMVQVMAFGELTYLLRVILGWQALNLAGAVRALVPANWFVLLYVGLYLISPYLNLGLERLTQKPFARLIGITGVLFSLWPTLVDLLADITGKEHLGLSTIGMYGSQWGYTIVNFVLMYILGAYLRLFPPKHVPLPKLLARFFLCAGLIALWARAGDLINRSTQQSAWAYSNPLVIAEAVWALQIGRELKLGSRVWINRLARGAFSAYLFHFFLIRLLPMKWAARANGFVFLGGMLASAIAIYLLSCCVDGLYHRAGAPLVRAFERRFHMPEIGIEDKEIKDAGHNA